MSFLSIDLFLKFLIGVRTALQYCVGFGHTSAWISQKYTYVSQLLNLSPHTIPPLGGCHREPDLSSCITEQIPTGFLILHMVICIFQCYSLNSSHPASSLSPQLCSLCLHPVALLWFNLNSEKSERSSASVEEAEKEEGVSWLQGLREGMGGRLFLRLLRFLVMLVIGSSEARWDTTFPLCWLS